MSRMAQNITFGIDMFAEQTRRERLSRMLAALSETNEAILRARSREELFPLVCEASARGGQFNSTTIFVADPAQGLSEGVGSPGPFGDYIRNLRIPLTGDLPEARGIVPTAFRTGKHCVVNEFRRDPRTRFWAEKNKKIGSGASFPCELEATILEYSCSCRPKPILSRRTSSSFSIASPAACPSPSKNSRKPTRSGLRTTRSPISLPNDLLTDLPNRATLEPS